MSLQGFLKENVVKPNSEMSFVVSDRFIQRDENGEPILDENGKAKPMLFKAKALKPDALLSISQDATSFSKNGNASLDTKNAVYKLIEESLVYPDLKSVELLDSYGVTFPSELINEMFTAQEITVIYGKANELNYGKNDLNGQIEEVKNY